MSQLKKKLFIALIVLFSVCMLVSCGKNGNGQDGNGQEEQKPIVYAQVEGRVVYYYNSYKGNVADNGAKVVLLKMVNENVDPQIASKIRDAIKYPKIYYEGHEEEFAELGLFMVKVDSNGDYTFNNIPNGKYTLYIHTNHVDFFGDITGAHKVTIKDIDYQIPFSSDQAQYYGFDQKPFPEWVTTSKYATKQINVMGTSYNAGETDFGMCYMGIGVVSPW